MVGLTVLPCDASKWGFLPPGTAGSKSHAPAKSRRGGFGREEDVKPVKVAYQGEPGAYSEKASRELLGGTDHHGEL